MAPTMNTPFPTSEALTRSVFLANSSPTDRYDIERVKPLLMDYLAVANLLLSIDIPSLHLHHVANVLAKQVYIMKSALRSLPLSMSLSPNNRILSLYVEICRHHCRTTASRELGNAQLHSTGNGHENEDELELLIRRVGMLPRVVKCGALLPQRLVASSGSSAYRARRRKKVARMTHFALSQLDSNHYGLEDVKHRLMEYLVVVRLRALIVQAEVEQAKAQEVTLKTIDERVAEVDN
ncbi:hypothetical protein V8E53_000591 [Lactarius tabidus]